MQFVYKVFFVLFSVSMWDIGCCDFSKYLKPANTSLEYDRSLPDFSEGRGVGIKKNLDGLKHISKQITEHTKSCGWWL